VNFLQTLFHMRSLIRHDVDAIEATTFIPISPDGGCKTFRDSESMLRSDIRFVREKLQYVSCYYHSQPPIATILKEIHAIRGGIITTIL